MKLAIAFGLFVATALAYPTVDFQPSEPGWFVPELDDTFSWMTPRDLEELKANSPQARATPYVEFYLYTNKNPNTPQQLFDGDVNTLKNSNFNRNVPTRFVIHGWQNNYQSDVNIIMRNAFLGSGQYNVIAVDWSSKAETINYAASVLRVPGAGKQVASMIDFLYTQQYLTYDSLLVVGHSLGAHVSGFAGKNVKYGRIGQITGLDPAYPLYSYDKPADRLNQNDAAYVETIQTCGGLLGFLEPIGRGSFYPNGGKSQPGCGIDLTGACAHSRSYEYYAEATLKNDFPSMKCPNYEAAVSKSCGSTYSSVRMGSLSNFINAVGDYYVPVNSKSPFGKGN